MARKKRSKDPEPLIVLDPAKQQAAATLAYANYQRGERRRTGAIGNAAQQAKVSVRTIYDWLEDEDFVACIEEQKLLLVLAATETLKRALEKDNPIAAIFLLKNLLPEVYDDQLQHLKEKHANALELKKLEGQNLKNALAVMPPLVYKEAVNLPDPDGGVLPEGLVKLMGGAGSSGETTTQ